MTDQTEFAKAEDEALDWAIFLADDPDDAELHAQFRAWLNSSPLHAKAWQRIQRVTVGLDALQVSSQEKINPTDRASVVSLHKAAPRSSRLTARQRKVLAGLALAACVGVAAFPAVSLRLSADYMSGTGEQQTHLMEDGSKLFLAPQSAVDIRYTQQERVVRLLKGSAFFEVAPDYSRPFHVETHTTQVTVKGTAFNVTRQTDGDTVSVAHGRVQVDQRQGNPAFSQQLGAGDQLTLVNGKASTGHINSEEVALWRSGEMIARDLPIGEIVDAFRPYFRGMIVVNATFSEQRASGLYRLTTPVETLTNLAQAHGAKAQQISPWLLVLSL